MSDYRYDVVVSTFGGIKRFRPVSLHFDGEGRPRVCHVRDARGDKFKFKFDEEPYVLLEVKL